MQILTFILSILAFLMGAVALVLIIREQHRNRRTCKALRKSLVDYVDRKTDEVADGIATGVKERMDIANSKIEKAANLARVANTRLDAIKKAVKENKDRIDDLEQGVVPDFETAQKAVNEVNNINKGIAGILGFDPLEALKQSRQEGD